MKLKQTALSGLAVAALTALPGAVSASGFALIEQSASGLGNAYAGGAASAEDASTIFFNPAGLSRLNGKQVVAAVHAITPSIKFSNTASTIPAPGFVAAPAGGDAGSTAVVPSAYFSWAIDSKLSAGIGFGVPFGLKTEYDANWMGRFHAIRSEVETVNVNPSVAYRVNDSLSVGAGVNWQRIEAVLTKAVNYAAFGAAAGTEGSNNFEGNDSTWGYNLGLMFNVDSMTVGMAYRSAMDYKISGTARYYGRTAGLDALIAAGNLALNQQIGDSAFTADIKLPATLSVAMKYQPNAQWDILADVTQTEWSSMQSLDLYRSSGIASGLVLESVPFKWRDTWRVGLGANHHYNEKWTARMGVAYDQTPTSDIYRIARVPDSDRIWLSFGGQYRMGKKGAFDFSYAHLFMKNAALNMNGPPALTAAQTTGRGALVGNYDSQADILSVQYTRKF